ncbi:MAG: hypothetical protein ACOCU4_06555 [Alkalispirochaeta sp.]
MNRKKIVQGQYFLSETGVSDANHLQSFDTVHLVKISFVQGDMVTCFNLSTQEEEPPVNVKDLTEPDCIAISNDMAEHIWRAMLGYWYERSVERSFQIISSYNPGVESVDMHSGL